MSCLGSSAFPVRISTELTHALSLCRGKEPCYKNITACKKAHSSAHWGQVSLPSSCMCGHGDRALLQPLDTQHDHTRCFRGPLCWALAALHRAEPSPPEPNPAGSPWWWVRIHSALYFNLSSLFVPSSSFLVAHSTATSISAEPSHMLTATQVVCEHLNSRSRWVRTGDTVSSSLKGTFCVCGWVTTTF